MSISSSQVEGRTDSSSRQVMTLLGAAFHQTHKAMADLASKAPSPPQSDSNAQQNFSMAELSSTSQVRQPSAAELSAAAAAATSSSSSSKGSQDKTFHSQAAVHNQTNGKGREAVPSTLKVSNPSANRSHDSTDSLSEAVKTMLEPLLSHFSADLTQELLKFIEDGSGNLKHH